MFRSKFHIYAWALWLLVLASACSSQPSDSELAGEALRMYPDYHSVVLPPNVAPMNFQVENEGSDFLLLAENEKGSQIRIQSKEGCMVFPPKAWKKLLEEGRGGELRLKVYRKRASKWEMFPVVTNTIAKEEIDPFIAFRKIPPANMLWKNMGIFQRSLEDFGEYPIMENSLTDENCMNCHAFNGANPEQMMFHMRAAYGGTFILKDGKTQFVNTKNEHTGSAGAYPSWHPGGELIAFSVNLIKQSFHSSMGPHSYVLDKYSDIILYDVNTNTVTRPGILASEKLENFPVWSSDGKSMYYLLADKHYDSLHYSKRQYHLMNIAFDADSRKFGKSDTLIDADAFGRSITFPRENPGQRLLSFVAVDYGYFSVYNKEADVFFLDLENGKVSRPGINSPDTESYPSWSSNGSWLMFISKRDDGLLSQPFFAHVDEHGVAAKPFVLPQKDPSFYREYTYNYNRPEFISGKVDLHPRKVYSLVKKQAAEDSHFNLEASVSISSGATATGDAPETGHYIYE